jgi:hypothetical protein
MKEENQLNSAGSEFWLKVPTDYLIILSLIEEF